MVMHVFMQNFKKRLAMKKIYTLSIPLVLLTISICSCTKDVLKSYENRIIGTWELYDVDKRGFGGNTANLPFRDGIFTFQEGGGLLYNNSSATQYNGSWDISRKWVTSDCTTDGNGNTNCSDRQVSSLQVTAIDFVNQSVVTENFEEIDFTSKDRLKAYIHSGAHTYVFYFRRQ